MSTRDAYKDRHLNEGMTITVEQRFDDLVGNIRELGLALRAQLKGSFDIDANLDLVYNAAVSIQIDIKRYKDFHLQHMRPRSKGGWRRTTLRANAVKRAAYTTKWLTKLKPISILSLSSTGELPWELMFSNELIAVLLSFNYIGAELKLKKIFRPTDEKMSDFVYDLHYREVTDAYLLSVYQVYYDIAKNLTLTVNSEGLVNAA